MESEGSQLRIKVVGVGGAGGNAVSRMADRKLHGLEFLAINTDGQALNRMNGVPTLAIGPSTTGGMGSGGNADVGRKAIRESHDQVAQLLAGADMVFVTAGMGGGTGTGAAPAIAEMAKRQGALTVAVTTRPFSFEGALRREVADQGLQQLEQKVDTLITVDNDRLLSSLDGKLSLEQAFRLADEVLRQGVQGISEIITVPGLINVDFADVRSVIADGGAAFMAVGEGKGRAAANEAVQSALANPLFDAPLQGATGILFNIKGGKDLELGEVNEVASIIREASQSQARVIFGVVQDPRSKKRVSITLVATGLNGKRNGDELSSEAYYFQPMPKPAGKSASNGHGVVAASTEPQATVAPVPGPATSQAPWSGAIPLIDVAFCRRDFVVSRGCFRF